MKLLITNTDALINPRTGEFYDGILDTLNNFNNDEDRGIVVISMHRAKLSRIPKEFNPLLVKATARKGRDLINYIDTKLGIEAKDCIVLGTKIDDVILAANNKLMLIRADYTKFLSPSNRIFTSNYGILGIRDANHLNLVLSKIKEIKNPWYFKLDVDEITTIYSLTNANTFSRQNDAKRLANAFKSLLKEGELRHFDAFVLYFMISAYVNFEEFKEIDYFGVYPSSSGKIDEDLEKFLTKFRESLGKKQYGQILIRTKAVAKRHLDRNSNHFQTIKDQVQSIVVNPKLDLVGRCVCIIDDFTTYGTSCETVRFLLQKVGVRKIIFISMGKFGVNYFKVVRNPFDNSYYTTYVQGEFNGKADSNFVYSLIDLL
ncbi:hypothetical protein [Sphingobacterium multivorum]|uniref:hypothetical protein n=1 Tax=Sphingobacterium multivorum TaxID=28454 RepID=UPI000E9E276B|nr:hypothetical protein [Sphingobacterium multivorum]HAF33277.1 hypothetical protein [Sphingobacterium sp.]HBI89195.1 hypothetical protein [Sphingobacterium sp.]